jgi:hypothetical protein
LTQLGQDIQFIKGQLDKRASSDSISHWLETTEKELATHMKDPVPTVEQLEENLLNGRPGGALQAAYQLPMLAACSHDISGKNLEIGKPLTFELHHIWPKKWCKSNAVGEYEELLDPKKGRFDYVNSIANLMPLSQQANRDWRDMSPANYIELHGVRFDAVADAMQASSIDKTCFELLKEGVTSVEQFWKRRARLLAERLYELTKLRM